MAVLIPTARWDATKKDTACSVRNITDDHLTPFDDHADCGGVRGAGREYPVCLTHNYAVEMGTLLNASPPSMKARPDMKRAFLRNHIVGKQLMK